MCSLVGAVSNLLMLCSAPRPPSSTSKANQVPPLRYFHSFIALLLPEKDLAISSSESASAEPIDAFDPRSRCVGILFSWRSVRVVVLVVRERVKIYVNRGAFGFGLRNLGLSVG